MRSNDGGSHSGSVADEILAAGEVSWDLREPLTREDVGMPHGRQWVPIANPGGDPRIDVHLELPSGGFDLDTRDIHLAGEPEAGVVERLTLTTERETTEQVHQQVLVEVDRLGLDRDRVDGWWATGSDMFDEGATYITRVFQGDAGGLPVEVQVSNPNDGSPVLTYFFYLDRAAP